MPTPLSKKTKNDLLEEYNKLLEQHEELKHAAGLLGSHESIGIISKVEGYTVDELTKSVSTLKTSVNATLNELADKLITEAQKFSEIQKAIGLAKTNLELHYHIQVAAETLERLISEHKTKTVTLEEEKTKKQREWTREEEEHEYIAQLKKRRTEEEFKELKVKQERELKERIELLIQQEKEIAQLREQHEGFADKLEYALKAREQEVTKRFQIENAAVAKTMQKEWDAQKNLWEMQTKNLEERIKLYQTEIATLKQETERANKRVQELAVTVIAGGTRPSAPSKSEDINKTVERAV